MTPFANATTSVKAAQGIAVALAASALFLLVASNVLLLGLRLRIFEEPVIAYRPFVRTKRGVGSGAIMDKEQLGRMSIDELWALHTEVDEILAARIVAKRTELERRLARLRPDAGRLAHAIRSSSDPSLT